MQHYRKFFASLPSGESTAYNRLRSVNTFLRRLEIEHGVNYHFRHSPSFKLEKPSGKKIQYTLAQLKTALSEATGIARTALLLGLNCGFYSGDIELLSQDKFDGSHINTARAKMRHKKNAMVGSWLLWPETKEVLQYGLSNRQVLEAYSKFAKTHQLPTHKALRKTVAQWLQDNIGEEESRLYRGENVSGTHGKSYIAFSEAQKAKLDASLMAVRAFLIAL